MIFCVYLCSNV